MLGSAPDLVSKVEAIVREVGDEVIRPRFRALGRSDVRFKSPGEAVTVADLEAERALSERLRGLVPAPVVGEEACATDPSLMRALGAEQVWVVDPIDGTANFIAGTGDWAVMVALCEEGHTVASWIWRPVSETMYTAERGAGAARNGRRLSVAGRRAAAPAPAAAPATAAAPAPAAAPATAAPVLRELRGAVSTRFLDPQRSERVDSNRRRFGALGAGSLCAGVDYPAVIEGALDFVLYWRTLPWDHAPGTLLLAESGGTARRPDGTAYRPGRPGEGLLAARDAPTWEAALAGLLSDVGHAG